MSKHIKGCWACLFWRVGIFRYELEIIAHKFFAMSVFQMNLFEFTNNNSILLHLSIHMCFRIILNTNSVWFISLSFPKLCWCLYQQMYNQVGWTFGRLNIEKRMIYIYIYITKVKHMRFCYNCAAVLSGLAQRLHIRQLFCSSWIPRLHTLYVWFY